MQYPIPMELKRTDTIKVVPISICSLLRDGGHALLEASSGDAPQCAADTPCEGVCLRERRALSYDGLRALSPLAAHRTVEAPKLLHIPAYQPRILGSRISRKASPSR